MKLELKHIKPYEKLRFKIEDPFELSPPKIDFITSIDLTDECLSFGDSEDYYLGQDNENVIYPILRPLSDLTWDDSEDPEYIIDKGLSADLNYYQWEYLFENHFDVFGLIENGLAISKNTLES